MDKKIIKIIYKIRYERGRGYHQVRKARFIKKILKERYNLTIKENDISEILRKYMPSLKTDYEDNQISLLMRIYSDFYDTQKGVDYVNKRLDADFTITSTHVMANKMGVKKKQKNQYKQSYITRKDESVIENLYNEGFSVKKIANMYGYKSKKSIIDKLEKRSVSRRHCGEVAKNSRKYKDFRFDILDDFNKAYFLGLLITDGYVNEDRNYIQLDLTDKDVIEYLSEYINCDYISIKPKNNVQKTKYRITLYGEEFVNQARRYGLNNDKTYSYSGFNVLPSEMKFIPDLIRGIIDGDGWIRKDGEEFFICSASMDFIKWVKVIMTDIGFINLNISYLRNEFNGIFIIRTASKKNISLLKTKIYKEEYGMMRKYNRLFGKNAQRA